MSFIQVTKEEFNTHAQQVSERSFMQTEEMAKLLEKRGFSISYVAWKEGNQIEVSAIVYSMPMTGGLRMEVNCGPIHSSVAHLRKHESSRCELGNQKVIEKNRLS